MPPVIKKRLCSLDQLAAPQFAVIAVMFAVWFFSTTLLMKAVAIFFSACFSVIEWNFYKYSTDNPDGSVTLHTSPVKPGFTTVEQFMMNVLYIPILTFGYSAIIPTWWLRVALSPFNLWLLEIVEGTILMALYGGYNPAWDYSDRPDGYVKGMIKLGHWKFWVVLGFLMELVKALV
eukprot:PhF_6_TR29041/c0_g1_i1/m.42281